MLFKLVSSVAFIVLIVKMRSLVIGCELLDPMSKSILNFIIFWLAVTVLGYIYVCFFM